MPTGLKHLITCRCVLPQYKRAPEPPQHQFVVFSIIEDNGDVRVKFSQCNNCGIIHKVTDVCRSEVVPREAMGSLPTADDIKVGLPQRLVSLLETADVDLSAWEQAQFIFENQAWGDFVILTTDEEDGMKQGKYVRIMGENMFKVESFTREEVASASKTK